MKRSLCVLFIGALWPAGVLQADTTVSVTHVGNLYTYSYKIQNTTSNPILAFSVDALGPITAVTSPTGWISTVTVAGSESLVQWMATDLPLETTVGGIQDGFSIASPSPPGNISFEFLDDSFGTQTGGSTGPVAPPSPVQNDFTPPLVTPPSSIVVASTEIDGTRVSEAASLAAFVSGGSAVDSVDPAPVRLVPQIGAINIENSTLFAIGTSTVTFRFSNSSGNVGIATASVTVEIAPVTTVSVSPGPNPSGWNNTSVVVSLMSAENGSGPGVKEITYSASGAQNIAATVVTASLASFSIANEGITTVIYFATDNAGIQEAPKKMIIQIDKTPPSISGSRAPAANAAGWNNSAVTVSFQCADSLSGLALGSPPAPKILSTEGANQSVTSTCQDVAGNSASATVSGINIDKTPPTVACSASPKVLWPPSNTLVPVNVSVTVTDSLSGAAGFSLVSVTSNEPDSGLGDIQGFIAGTPSTSGELRAQRLGSGSGRTYTFTYSGSDRAGNQALCTTTVTVPHDQGH